MSVLLDDLAQTFDVLRARTGIPVVTLPVPAYYANFIAAELGCEAVAPDDELEVRASGQPLGRLVAC